MSSSKRLAIVSGVGEALEKITIDNGFNTDLGLRVFYWQDLDFQYKETGAINFKDLYEEMADQNIPYQHELYFEVEAIKFSDNWLEDSHLLLQDLIKAININFSGALRTSLISNEKTIETKGEKAIRVSLKFKVKYRE